MFKSCWVFCSHLPTWEDIAPSFVVLWEEYTLWITHVAIFVMSKWVPFHLLIPVTLLSIFSPALPLFPWPFPLSWFNYIVSLVSISFPRFFLFQSCCYVWCFCAQSLLSYRCPTSHFDLKCATCPDLYSAFDDVWSITFDQGFFDSSVSNNQSLISVCFCFVFCFIVFVSSLALALLSVVQVGV